VGALDLAFSPTLPLWALLALAAATLLLAGLGVARRARGVWLRLLFAAVLLTALAQPALVREQREGLDDLALVVVDRSPSQRIGERREQTDAALERLRESLEALPATEVRVVESSGHQPGGDGGTRLFGEIGRALTEVSRERVGAVFMIGDGQVHDVPEEVDRLGLDAPFHLLRSGEDEEADRRLTLVSAPSYGLVGRPLELTLRVDDLPEPRPGEIAQVRLSIDGREVERLPLPLGEERSVTFELERRGPAVVEVEVEAGPDELTLVNNRAAAIVNGVRDRLRVLLVSGEPHLGERAWRNILKSDPSVDLVHFTILRPPEKQDGTPIRELALIAFPTRELFELKLHEFDLVIFDRYRRRGVLPSTYYDNVARYVEGGGALLEAAGPATATPMSIHRTPLRAVLPGEPTGRVIERGFRPRVTEVGLRHPVTADLEGGTPDDSGEPSWGRWFRMIESSPLEGEVVMSGVDGLPLLQLARVGEGRVAQINSDQMWLWSRGFEGGGPQAELLRRTAHWLMKEPDLEEEDLRARVEGGELVVTRRSLSEDPAEVEVSLPGGERLRLPLEAEGPGLARGRLPAEETGLYRVADGERVALAPAGPVNPREFEDPRATDALLQPVMAATGGTFAALSNEGVPALRKVAPGRDRHGPGWMGVVGRGAYLVTGVERVPLLPGLLVLLLALGALLAAWHREGR